MAEDKQRPNDRLPGEAPGDEPARTDPSAVGADEASGARPEIAVPEQAGAATKTDASFPGGGSDAEDPAAAERRSEAAPAGVAEPREVRAGRPRTPWGAMLASGLLGGAVVALAAGYVWSTYLADEGVTNVLWARLGAVELSVQDLNARGPQSTADGPNVDELAARLARVEAALAGAAAAGASPSATSPSAQGGEMANPEQIASLETRVKTLVEGVARLDSRENEMAAAVKELREHAGSSAASPAEPGAAKAEFDALDQRVATLQQNTTSLHQALAKTTDALQQMAARGANTAAADRAVRLAVLAAGLRNAVAQGAPFAGELKAAQALLPDPQAAAPLERFAASGVPTAEKLGRELAALAPQLMPSTDSGQNGGYLSLLQSHAERLVRIRPVSEASGDDAAAIVARIETKAKQQDIAGALAELQKLPESARAPAQEWIKTAQEREAAVAAAQRIETDAIAALANP